MTTLNRTLVLLVSLTPIFAAAGTTAIPTTASTTAAAAATEATENETPRWLVGKFTPGGTFFGKYPDGTCVLTVSLSQLSFSESSSGPTFTLKYKVVTSNADFIVIETHGVIDDSKANCLQGDPSAGYLRIDRNVCRTSTEASCSEFHKAPYSPWHSFAFVLTFFDTLEHASAAARPELKAIQLAKGAEWRESYY